MSNLKQGVDSCQQLSLVRRA